MSSTHSIRGKTFQKLWYLMKSKDPQISRSPNTIKIIDFGSQKVTFRLWVLLLGDHSGKPFRRLFSFGPLFGEILDSFWSSFLRGFWPAFSSWADLDPCERRPTPGIWRLLEKALKKEVQKEVKNKQKPWYFDDRYLIRPDETLTFDRFWMDFDDLSYENDGILEGFWEVQAKRLQKGSEGLQIRQRSPGLEAPTQPKGPGLLRTSQNLSKSSPKTRYFDEIQGSGIWISGSGPSDLDLRAQKEVSWTPLEIGSGGTLRIWTPCLGD